MLKMYTVMAKVTAKTNQGVQLSRDIKRNTKKLFNSKEGRRGRTRKQRTETTKEQDYTLKSNHINYYVNVLTKQDLAIFKKVTR